MPPDPLLQRILDDLQVMKNDLERIERKLFGNGTTGLNTEVDRLKRWVETRERIETWILRPTVSVLVVGALSAAAWLIFQMKGE